MLRDGEKMISNKIYQELLNKNQELTSYNNELIELSKQLLEENESFKNEHLFQEFPEIIIIDENIEDII